MVVDAIAAAERGMWAKKGDSALVCETSVKGKRTMLVKPQTFMNLSGRAVMPMVRKAGYDPSEMIVIHDDLDLALGRVRIKVGGGDGGHKGIRSLADCLQFRDFTRVRLGIGRPPSGVPAEAFVLAGFAPADEALSRDLVALGTEAVYELIEWGVARAQLLIHSKE
jgi:peptidyl-tRNA hydrolase, PTH1 family